MPEKTGGKRARMTIFRGADALPVSAEMMPREGIDDGVLAGLALLAQENVQEGVGEQTRVLFGDPEKGGMSLLHAWFKSGYVLPFHSHSTDCLYYIIAGELHMGSHVLKQGDGFFVPADAGYGYEAGPEGVEVLEFRDASQFNLFFRGNKPERWEQIAAAFRERGQAWAGETTPPSRR
ncbi:MAG: hypothetical protein HKN19_00895 [Halioglobus sp.]|nr:hypothetical protein [Halioglobus sp.]